MFFSASMSPNWSLLFLCHTCCIPHQSPVTSSLFDPKRLQNITYNT